MKMFLSCLELTKVVQLNLTSLLKKFHSFKKFNIYTTILYLHANIIQTAIVDSG